MEKVHCWAGRAERWKKEMLSSAPVLQLCTRVQKGSMRTSLQPVLLGPGSCSSSPAVSYVHRAQNDPSVIKGSSLRKQEQMCNGCPVWKGQQDTYSPCYHSPVATGASCECFEIGIVSEPSSKVPLAALGQVKPSSGSWVLASIYICIHIYMYVCKMHWEAAEELFTFPCHGCVNLV